MNSKIYEICAIVGFILCLTLCLIFVPNIGALKFIAIIIGSFCAGIISFEVSYFGLLWFLETPDPSKWSYAILETMYSDGTKKYLPVVKSVKFGYYTNIDKTFLSSVFSESEFDTYEEAEEVIKDFKELEIELYQLYLKKLHDKKKLKVVHKNYIEI